MHQWFSLFVSLTTEYISHFCRLLLITIKPVFTINHISKSHYFIVLLVFLIYIQNPQKSNQLRKKRNLQAHRDRWVWFWFNGMQFFHINCLYLVGKAHYQAVLFYVFCYFNLYVAFILLLLCLVYGYVLICYFMWSTLLLWFDKCLINRDIITVCFTFCLSVYGWRIFYCWLWFGHV